MVDWRDKIYDREPIDRAIEFCGMLRQPDGLGSGNKVILAEFQRDIAQIFGKDKNGDRVVNRVLITVPRKNAKTTIVSFFILYLLVLEPIRNAQHYSIAADRDQAAILFNYARNIVQMSPELSSIISITESKKLLTNTLNGGTFQALSSEGKTKHGKSSRLVVVDELHAIPPASELVSVMETSAGAYGKEGLFIIIGTQSPDDNNPMSEWVDYARSVANGDIEDDNFAGFVWAAPEDADIWDEQVWFDCNPAMVAGFRSIDEMRQTAKRAKAIGGVKVAQFQNLYLNQRIDSSTPFIARDIWVSNGLEVDDKAFKLYPVYGGLDLSSRGDLTSLVLACMDLDGLIHIKVYVWTPEDLLHDHEVSDKAPYRDWVSQGIIEAVPGKSISYDWVAYRIGEITSEIPQLNRIAYDRWKIDELQWHLNNHDVILPLSPFGQGFRDMSPAIDDLTHYLAEHEIRHGMNKVLTWAVSNAVAVRDPAGNTKLDKEKSFNRIDPVIAMVMAVRELCVDKDHSGISGSGDGVIFV